MTFAFGIIFADGNDSIVNVIIEFIDIGLGWMIGQEKASIEDEI